MQPKRVVRIFKTDQSQLWLFFLAWIDMAKELITTANFLHAYSRGEISSSEAIKGIGGTGYRQLTQLMAELDIPLPRGTGTPEELQKEVDDFLPILRQHLIEVGEIEP